MKATHHYHYLHLDYIVVEKQKLKQLFPNVSVHLQKNSFQKGNMEIVNPCLH